MSEISDENLYIGLLSEPFVIIDINVVQQLPPFTSYIDEPILTNLVKEKSLVQLEIYGGVKGISDSLETDLERGIDGNANDIGARSEVFGRNTYQEPPRKSFFHFMCEPLKEPIIFLLLVCAALSLGFGIKKHGLNEGWYDGGSILLAVLIVMLVSASNNFKLDRRLSKLSGIVSNNITVGVVRDGKWREIQIFEIVVGDVVSLKIGDRVPADGLYIEGESFHVNESALTKLADSVQIIQGNNPFLIAGSNVTNGSARMLVTAVGMRTKWGDMMTSTTWSAEHGTPLQVKLHKLTHNTAKAGLGVAFMVLVVLLIRYFTGNLKDGRGAAYYASSKTEIHHVYRDIIGILVTPIVIASAAVPEGLLLAVTVARAYSTKKMASEKAIVRNLAACEAIGSIQVICVDWSATISPKSPKVEMFWLGQTKFTKGNDSPRINEAVLQLIYEGIGLTTIFGSSSQLNEFGAEKAICDWAVQELGMNLARLKENCSLLETDSLNLWNKKGSICIRRETDNTIHIHMKGPTDKILAMCSCYYERTGVIRNISGIAREEFKKIVQETKNNGLNCIAYAHEAVIGDLDDEHSHPKLKGNLILIGFLCLKDLFRSNISNALKECQEAGVNVKMVTREDVQKAKEWAVMCGIFDPDSPATATDDGVTEAMEFRNFTDQQRLEKVETLNVIAGASTSDKLLLVQCLKQKGHIVGVIGGCPGDERVFEEADVGFHLGIQESHSMKEKSDIIILGDSFIPVVRAMRWGRGMHVNIQKCAQFQLTATIASLMTDSVTASLAGELPTINIVTAISSGKVPIAAFQILWVKLIVGTLVILALSMDNPAGSPMHRLPTGLFITNIMWRDITGQALCQIIILLAIEFEGHPTFKLSDSEKDTIIFNIMILCHIFTIFNTAKQKNMLERSKLFWMVIAITILLQVVIVELLSRFADMERLDWKQWRACIGIALLYWLVGWLVKRIPVAEKSVSAVSATPINHNLRV